MARKNIFFICLFLVMIVISAFTINLFVTNFFDKKNGNDNNTNQDTLTPAEVLIEDKKEISNSYNIEADNVYRTITPKEAINILEGGTGIIFIGFPACPWCQRVAPVLDKAAKEAGIKEIFYLNIYDIRKENTEEYQKIVELLGDNLLVDEDTGKKRIYVPDVYGVKNGKVTLHHLDVLDDYTDNTVDLTDDQILELKGIYFEIFKSVYGEDCEC